MTEMCTFESQVDQSEKLSEIPRFPKWKNANVDFSSNHQPIVVLGRTRGQASSRWPSTLACQDSVVGTAHHGWGWRCLGEVGGLICSEGDSAILSREVGVCSNFRQMTKFSPFAHQSSSLPSSFFLPSSSLHLPPSSLFASRVATS